MKSTHIHTYIMHHTIANCKKMYNISIIYNRGSKKMCVWVEDADKLDFDSTGLSVVYKNKTVTSALSESHLGIAGIKGQGKTFLIKVKRKKFENNPSILCLPKSKMVDTIDSSICINSSLIGILKDYNYEFSCNFIRSWS